MNPGMLTYAIWAAAAGASVPVMASMTGAMGRHLQAPLYAALISVGIAVLALAAGVLGTRAAVPGGAAFAQTPAWVYLGGLGMAFYALSAAFVTPRFGVGNFVMCVVCAQLVMSTLIDQFGLFGAPVHPVDLKRLAGLGLLGAGAALVAIK